MRNASCRLESEIKDNTDATKRVSLSVVARLVFSGCVPSVFPREKRASGSMYTREFDGREESRRGRHPRARITRPPGLCPPAYPQNLCLYLAFICGIGLATRKHPSLGRFSPLTRLSSAPLLPPNASEFKRGPSYNFQLFGSAGGTEIFSEIVERSWSRKKERRKLSDAGESRFEVFRKIE